MSDYDGHVETGTGLARRRVTVGGAEVEIAKRSVGPMDNNAYLLTDVASGEALLVDAANDAPALLDLLDGVRLRAIHTTHGHFDHWQALEAVQQATGAPVWIGPGDQELMEPRADRVAEHGGRLRVGAFEAEFLHTPGHTPGSVCVLLRADDRRHLFTGDTLFPGGPGNTFGNADAFGRIMRSLRECLFTLPDDTWVYPGHGDDTTLGAERPHLDEWEARGW
jgi:glyoxylase-like metal-dependent hydrolase (beta-lactamase superfamily II)